MLVTFVFPLEILAAVLAFLARDTRARAFGGDYCEQLEQLATEPGVRQRL